MVLAKWNAGGLCSVLAPKEALALKKWRIKNLDLSTPSFLWSLPRSCIRKASRRDHGHAFPDGILFDDIIYKILPGGYAVIGKPHSTLL